MWIHHHSFPSLVSNSGLSQQNYFSAIGSFQQILFSWNKTTFGNTFQKRKKLLARLQGIQNTLPEKRYAFLINLKGKLQNDYIDILKQERFFWQQK